MTNKQKQRHWRCFHFLLLETISQPQFLTGTGRFLRNGTWILIVTPRVLGISSRFAQEILGALRSFKTSAYTPWNYFSTSMPID
jgi:hypothetical protein